MLRFLVIILVLLIIAGGCTLNFKGTDIELESELVRRYELESIDLLKPQPTQTPERRFAWTD